MKIFEYLITALAFSIQAVSLNFTQEHCDYLETLDADHRTYFVLATVGIHEEFENDDSVDKVTQNTIHKLALNIQNNVNKAYESGQDKNQDLKFKEIIYDKYPQVFEILNSIGSFWNDDKTFVEWSSFSNSVYIGNSAKYNDPNLYNGPLLDVMLCAASCLQLQVVFSGNKVIRSDEISCGNELSIIDENNVSISRYIDRSNNDEPTLKKININRKFKNLYFDAELDLDKDSNLTHISNAINCKSAIFTLQGNLLESTPYINYIGTFINLHTSDKFFIKVNSGVICHENWITFGDTMHQFLTNTHNTFSYSYEEAMNEEGSDQSVEDWTDSQW